MKKNPVIAGKAKKKSIPINININLEPGKIFISNQINPIASSYLSMGKKIQNTKNIKYSKFIHVNTNSAVNYYTLNSKDSKLGNNSITNSLLNNFQNNNNSDYNDINFNSYLNSNNNHNHHLYDMNSIEKNVNKYNINFNSKARKQLSTISNSLLTNDLLINGFQTSKNNNSNLLNNIKPKNKLNTNSKNNISRIKTTYSTRPNFLDSRNKTKKVPMKSKIRQFKNQFKGGKPVSTSFSKVHVKNNFQGYSPRDLYNYGKTDMLNNITYENSQDSMLVKYNTNGNFIINKNLYENKNKHFRHNTASFDNKDIINIFNKNHLSNKSTKNINNININNINNITNKINNINNICINNINSNKITNLNQGRNLVNKINNLDFEVITPSNQSINKINYGNNIKKNQFSKGKINDIKIYINEKKFNHKVNKFRYINNISNNNINDISNNNNSDIYHNYNCMNDNLLKNNYNSIVHHMKNSHSINANIPGIKKVFLKQKEIKKNNSINTQNRLINKPIPAPNQKLKGNGIPSQRNIKINLAKFLQDVKVKQNNKLVMGRKSASIKRVTKENNSDFSISQLNEKIAKKILKNNDEGNDIRTYIINNKKNINKTIQEEIKKELTFDEKHNINKYNDIDKINNNILIDTNYISNVQYKSMINRGTNIPSNLINEICNNNANIGNNYNYYKLNYNGKISTTNNNYGKNKNDYSIDIIPNLTSTNNNKYLKNDENINSLNLNLNKVTDINKLCLINKNNINENTKEKNLVDINVNENYDIRNDDDILSKKNKNNINIINDDISIPKISKLKIDRNINDNKLIDNKISNNLFDEDNLNDLPEDYDENFNDLYSIINKMNFGNVLVCVEGLFTAEGRTYKKYKEKFDKFYDKQYCKKGNSFVNSNNKPKKVIEGISVTSNTKTSSSSSKKNPMYNNDMNIVKELNAY